MANENSRRRKQGKRSALQGPDEEETRLTQSLFGSSGAVKVSAKRSKQEGSGITLDVDKGDVELDGDDDDKLREQHLDDDQLFMLDTASAADDAEDDVAHRSSDDQTSSSTSEDSSDEEEAEKDQYTSTPREKKETASSSKARRRKPVWSDPSSAALTVTLSGPDAKAEDGSRRGMNKLRRLRETADEVTVTGLEYEARLRKMYEKLHPRPRWASLALRSQHANASSSSLGELLNSDVGLVNRVTMDAGRRRQADTTPLAQRRLEIQRLRNANESQGRSGDLSPIETLSFHPSTRANILMSTSKDRRVRLFNVDGKENALLNTVHVADLPLRNARFHPSGSSILLTGPRPFFYVYDMYADTTIKSTPWRAEDEAAQERDFSIARFAPENGRRLAIGGRRGATYIMDWRGNAANASSSMGSSVIGTVRMNAPLAGLAWDGTHDDRLVTLSTQGTLHTWDVRSMRCEVQRTDAGLFAPTQLECSPSAQWWAVGSENGIVNMYGREAVEGANGGGAASLEARKSIDNIVTATTSLSFNPTGEMLAIASKRKKDTMKLAHTSSLTVYENWPTSDTPLGSVSAVGFSNDSKYLAIGNHRGKVLLYTLHHYT